MDYSSSFLSSLMSGTNPQRDLPSTRTSGDAFTSRRTDDRQRSSTSADDRRRQPSYRDRERERDRDRPRERDRRSDLRSDRDRRRSPPRGEYGSRRRRSRSPPPFRGRRESERSGGGRRNDVVTYSPPPPDIVPLHLRERKLNNWDVRPQGYDSITAEQAKATGTIGAFNTNAPQLGYSYGPTPMLIENAMKSSSNSRQLKRLFVGDLPTGTTEQEIIDLMSAEYEKLGVPKEQGNACISVHINTEKNYCFAEVSNKLMIKFRTPEEAAEAMALDGVVFKDHVLKVRRPKDYNTNDSVIPGLGDSPFRIFVGGLPDYLTEPQIKDLLEAFGPLKFFKLMKDQITGQSKGFALCEYQNTDLTDVACEGLHGLELGENKLVMQRASIAAPALMGGPLPVAAPILPIEIIGGANLKPSKPTAILLLLNCVLPEELEDDDEYEDISNDIKDECSRFGEVVEIMLPRPLEGAEIPGVGKVFVKYSNPESALKAQRALAGRKFAERTVLATFYDEVKFAKGKLE